MHYDAREPALRTAMGFAPNRVAAHRPRALARAATLATLLAGLWRCSQGLGAFTQGVGNTTNRPPGTAFRVLGQPGLQFTAIVWDTQSAWTVQGAIPFNVIVIHNTTPVKMIATKLSPGTGIMSLQLTVGSTVVQIAFTVAPYGSATLQSNPIRPGFGPPAPKADPDVRVFVKAPRGERFSGLIEDTSEGILVSDRVPALFLFDQPDGAVDATLDQIQTLGPFDAYLLLNGAVIDHATGQPTVTLRQ